MISTIINKYAVPIMVSVGLHALVIMAMLVGWSAEPTKKEVKRPNFVQAKLVKLDAQAQPKKPPQADKPKIVDLTQKQKELDKQKKLAEQKRQQKIKQQEVEKKQKAEAERQKKDAERKAKEKAEAERKAKAEAEQKRQEQVQRQKQQQEAFEQALAEEEMLLQEESYAVAAQSYMAAISQRIEQNWSRPPSARNDMECELLIKLVPTGRVINVDIVKSSGNELFDRSAVQAVQKAEQFPEIKEMKPEVFERYYRELNLVFRPQDLRQ